MKLIKATALLVATTLVAGCLGEGGFGRVNTDKTRDYGFRSHHLSDMTAGIWVDPNGCDHWIIDDGIEGYLSVRLDKYGKPVCSGAAPPNTATGPFKSTQTITDPL
jgi:hypothetical protein